MTIDTTPTAPPEASPASQAQEAGHDHLGASPRPRHYAGRHRRPHRSRKTG